MAVLHLPRRVSESRVSRAIRTAPDHSAHPHTSALPRTAPGWDGPLSAASSPPSHPASFVLPDFLIDPLCYCLFFRLHGPQSAQRSYFADCQHPRLQQLHLDLQLRRLIPGLELREPELELAPSQPL